ncbi:MAG: phosphoribosylaminoimidazolesuccinocarboxamide synthase [Deltaproteobacteria bacterium]|nr:phosphoribosylaminoimidazolesuccinocarboxamide synthase [Deltaproteobacteria bacterium]
MKALINTDHFGLSDLFKMMRGKVRDVFDLGNRLLIISTDRLSAHDVVLPNPIVGRGIILTQMTIKWLDKFKVMFKDLSTYLAVEHHIVSTSVDDLQTEFKKFAGELAGRFMIVHKCIPLPIEFIVRGYISGSLWKQYKRMVAESSDGPIILLGHEFPRNLQESQQLENVIFTPSTKAEAGAHDENISYEEMVKILHGWLKENGHTNIDAEKLAEQCRNVSVKLYSKAREVALEKGIIIADTKFELALRFVDGKPILVIIDEVLTPDSSRFWPADKYVVGQSQPSFDKQPVRDHLSGLNWDKTPPAPELPPEIVEATEERYQTAERMLFG